MDITTYAMAKAYTDSAVSGASLLPERFAYKPKKRMFEIFSTGHGWSKTSPAASVVAADTTNYRTGTQGIKLTAVPTSSSVCWIDESFASTTDLLGKGIEIDVHIPDVSKVESIDILLSTTTGFTNFFVGQVLGLSLRDGWNRIGLLPDLFNKLGSSPPLPEDLAAIESWRVKIIAKAGQTAVVTFDSIQVVHNPLTRGKVIISMDDGWDSQWVAKQIMDKYGFRGVAYLITGDYTKDTIASNRMTRAQINTLDALGWDLCSHTVTHRTLPSLSAADLTAELRDSKKWLIDNGFIRGSHHIATPGGQHNPTTLAETAKYYTTHRTILDGEEYFPPADPLRIKTRQMFNYVTESEIKGWIDNCAAHKYVLVLTTHRFVSPANADIEMTPTLFDTICAYLKTKEDADEIDVGTWSDLVAQVSPL